MPSYATLRGSALDASQSPLRDLHVALFRASAGRTAELARAFCDIQGRFVFDVDFSVLAPSEMLAVRAYQGTRPVTIAAGEQLFRARNLPEHLVLTIDPYAPPPPVEEPPTSPGSSVTSVRGRLTHTDGNLLSGLTVRAYQRDMDADTQLQLAAVDVDATTDSEGRYTITYDTTGVDTLVLKAFDGPTELGESEVVYNPDTEQVLGIEIDDDDYRAQPAFQALEAAIATMTISSWAGVKANGKMLLAGKLKRSKDQIDAYVDAKALFEANASILPTSPATPWTEVFYALFSQAQDRDLDALLTTAQSSLERPLVRAAALNEVSEAIGTNAASHAQAIRDFWATRALNNEGPIPLDALLEHTSQSTNPTNKLSFASQLAAHDDPATSFWDILTGFDAAQTEELRRMMTLGRWSRWAPQVLEAVNIAHGSDPIEEVAAFTADDWEDILTQTLPSGSLNIPPEFQGSDEDERRAKLIEYMRRQGELEHPSYVVRARLLDTIPAGDVRDYLEGNPDHDFNDKVDDVMVAGATDELALKTELRRLQRLFRVCPDFERHDAMTILEGAGFNSAWDIGRAGEHHVEDAAPTLDTADVSLIVNRARAINARVTTTFMQVVPGQTDLPDLPGNDPDDIVQDPEMIDLLGNYAFCQCKHCRSLLSPAAYLVDLLAWGPSRETIRTALDARRPDIIHLKLSCENTNTLVPYVDLVLEILEDAVVPRTGPYPDTGDATAEELAANPKFVNGPAYDLLREAVSPPRAPFDYFGTHAELFMTHEGVDRAELMKVFQSSNPTDASIAAVTLGLSPTGYHALIATAPSWWATTPSTDEFAGMLWGYPPPNTWITNLTGAGGVAAMRARANLSRAELVELMDARFWNPVTAGVPAFTLDPIALCDPDETTIGGSPAVSDFTRLMQFIRAWRITGWTTLTLDKVIQSRGWTDIGSSEVMELARLVRLEEQTGLHVVELLTWWSVIDTREDRPLADPAVLSLYDETFNRRDALPNLQGSGTELDDLFELHADRDRLNHEDPGPPPAMRDYLQVLQATLGLSEGALVAAIDDLGGDPLFTLDNLSALYRRASLARALGTTVQQALAIRDLQWLHPAHLLQYIGNLAPTEFSGNTYTDGDVAVVTADGQLNSGTLDVFAGDVVRFQTSAWATVISGVDESVAAGTRLVVSGTTTLHGNDVAAGDEGKVATFAGTANLGALMAPNEGALIKVLDGVHFDDAPVLQFTSGAWVAGTAPADPFADPRGATTLLDFAHDLLRLEVSIDELVAVSRPDDGVIDSTLPTFEWRQAQLGALRDLVIPNLPTDARVDPNGAILESVIRAQLGLDPTVLMARLRDEGTALVSTDLDTLAGWIDPDVVGDLVLQEQGAVLPAEHRFRIVLYGLDLGIAKRLAAEAVVGQLALAAEVDVEVVQALRGHTLPAAGDQEFLGAFLSRQFLDGANVGDWADIDPTTQPDVLGAFDVLLRVARLAAAFQATAREMAWWLADNTHGMVALHEMASDQPIAYPAWQATLDAFRLRDRLPGDFPTFAGLMTHLADPAEFFEALEERTGWPADELQVLAGALSVTDYGLASLNRLARCAEIAEALGTDVATAYEWRHHDLRLVSDRFRDVIGSVRGKYSDTSWQPVAKPLRDQLRERQRAALVDYLLGTRDDLATAADLFAYYLVDPEMSPCMLTSRVKHAIGSVQLLIHRAMMSEEPTIDIGPQGESQWEWMRSYRVWEAARRVFLYPENYVIPELRSDKSSVSEALEAALAAGELNQSTIANAIESMLLELQAIGRFDVVAIHHPENSGATVDIVARTTAEPQRYFHLHRNPRGIWAPHMEIEGVPDARRFALTRMGGRLRLFFVTTSSVPASEDGEQNYQTADRLGWVEHSDAGWRPPREFPIPGRPTFDSPRTKLAVSASLDGTPKTFDLILRDGGNRVRLMFSHQTETVESGTQVGIGTDLTLKHLDPVAYYWQPAFARGWTDVFPLMAPFSLESRDFWGRILEIPTGAAIRVVVEASDGALAPSRGPDLMHENPFVLNTIEHILMLQPRNNGRNYQVEVMYHPFTTMLLGEYRERGTAALYHPAPGSDLDRQRVDGGSVTDFFTQVAPALLGFPDTLELVWDFDRPYAIVNWEVFLFAPLVLADRLMVDQQFAEAMSWLHAVYNPLSRDSVDDLNALPWNSIGDDARVWRFRPFLERSPVDVRAWGAFTGADDPDGDAQRAFEAQVDEWRRNPFDPHLIARLRPGSYARATFFKYLDNLISWGDQLFRRDTMETVNEATNLYLLALRVLGERPEAVAPRIQVEAMTFDELKNALDDFSNPMVAMENLVLPSWYSADQEDAGYDPGLHVAFYFCVPENDKLLGYYDVVEDRLYKIRHCLDIEGRRRTLPLFEPPIDPAALVRAVGMGASITDALADLNAPLPVYRFASMLQRTRSLVGSVQALGGALLQAIEKRDAEDLAVLRSGLELELQGSMRRVREEQLRVAQEQVRTSEHSKAEAEARLAHYERLLDKGLLPAEVLNEEQQRKSHRLEMKGQGLQALGGALTVAIPTLEGPFPLKAKFGGQLIGASVAAAGQAWSIGASAHRHSASMASLKASNRRRAQEWRFQIRSAKKQIRTIDKQIEAAEQGVVVAQKELENHDRQTANLRRTDEFMRAKFTNPELYHWMVAEISKVYFQAYELAHSYAKKAEQCYRHELAAPDAAFIVAGHWDNLRKGLLAGARLNAQLDAMDAAYLDNDVRELELVKHVSLRELDPLALVRLIELGSCYFELAEVHYDLDVPGSYLRRLRGVSLTIPGITGPYTTVNARLTLHASKIRRISTGDPVDEAGPIESIVTSGRPDDSGLFQFDFNDARYLPFERRGAISIWKLELTGFPNPTYDPRAIEDVMMTVRYTAREGARAFDPADELDGRAELDENANPVATGGELPAIVFSVRADFPDAYHALMTDPSKTLTLPVTVGHFPRLDGLLGPEIVAVEVIPLLESTSPGIADNQVTVTVGAGTPANNTTRTDPDRWTVTMSATSVDTISVAFTSIDSALLDGTTLDATVFGDILVLLRYGFS